MSQPIIYEIIGTFLLILFGTGVNANVSLKKTFGTNAGWLTINLGWGIAVFIGVFVAGPVSGAHLNPAVTLGLAVAGKFDWIQVIPYMTAQLVGALLGAFITFIVYKSHFELTEENDVKLGVFSTGPAIPHTLRNFISEVVGTFSLVFPVFYLVSGQGLGSLDALPVALLVVGIGISLGGTTGYAINPARDLGPRIIHAFCINKQSNWGYAWVPVVAPLLGAVLAGFIYLQLN